MDGFHRGFERLILFENYVSSELAQRDMVCNDQLVFLMFTYSLSIRSLVLYVVALLVLLLRQLLLPQRE